MTAAEEKQNFYYNELVRYQDLIAANCGMQQVVVDCIEKSDMAAAMSWTRVWMHYLIENQDLSFDHVCNALFSYVVARCLVAKQTLIAFDAPVNHDGTWDLTKPRQLLYSLMYCLVCCGPRTAEIDNELELLKMYLAARSIIHSQFDNRGPYPYSEQNQLIGTIGF